MHLITYTQQPELVLGL